MLCRCGLYGGYQKGCYEVSITVTLRATIGDTSGFYGVLGSRAHLLYGFRGFQVYGLGFDPSRFGFQKVFQEVSVRVAEGSTFDSCAGELRLRAEGPILGVRFTYWL